ncbi:MAG: hypothetical protein IIB07_08965 [Bacteroidetes bacterium]|nr:hypothetical protein [Bacteroidota bacterium]
MKKKVYIPKDSTVFEQAEQLAGMMANQSGFKKGTKKYKDAVDTFLYDRYENSSIPHMSNPEIPAYIEATTNTLKEFLDKHFEPIPKVSKEEIGQYLEKVA